MVLVIVGCNLKGNSGNIVICFNTYGYEDGNIVQRSMLLSKTTCDGIGNRRLNKRTIIRPSNEIKHCQKAANIAVEIALYMIK